MKRLKEKDKIRLLLEAYLSGNLPADVQKRLQAWFIKNNEYPQHVEILRKIWDERVNVSHDPMSEEARVRFERYKALLGFPTAYAEDAKRLMQRLEDQERARVRQFRQRILWGAAAAAVLIPVLFMIGSRWMVSTPTDEYHQPVLAHVSVPIGVEEVKHIVMADESQVDIQPGSEIEFTEGFANRNVKLEGEAHFHVEKQTNAQGQATNFTVETDRLTITVLGTDFRVHCPASGEHSEIDLYHGKVEVEASGKKSILNPGDHFYYDHATGEHVITRIPAVEREFIKMDEMLFEGAGLEAIFDSLRKNYGVEVIINGHLPIEKVRADFRDANSIEEILVSLSKINKGFTYEMKGEKVEINLNK